MKWEKITSTLFNASSVCSLCLDAHFYELHALKQNKRENREIPSNFIKMLTLLICSLNNRVVDLNIMNHLSPISTSVLWNIHGKSAFSRKFIFELFQSDVCTTSFHSSNCRVKEMSSTLKNIYMCIPSVGLCKSLDCQISDYFPIPLGLFHVIHLVDSP